MAEETTRDDVMTEETQTDAAAGGVDNGGQNETPEDGKPVQLTQKQLDDLINKAYARGARKGKREAAGKPTAKQETSGDDGEAEEGAAAKALIQKATERMLSGTVRELAADLGITAKGARAALRLANFGDCIKDDEVDEASVKDILEDFAKEYPEFSSKAEDTETKPKSWGMRQGAGQKASGVEAAFFARNPELK